MISIYPGNRTSEIRIISKKMPNKWILRKFFKVSHSIEVVLDITNYDGNINKINKLIKYIHKKGRYVKIRAASIINNINSDFYCVLVKQFNNNLSDIINNNLNKYIELELSNNINYFDKTKIIELFKNKVYNIVNESEYTDKNTEKCNYDFDHYLLINNKIITKRLYNGGILWQN